MGVFIPAWESSRSLVKRSISRGSWNINRSTSRHFTSYPTAMIVHYRGDAHVEKAPCGYVFQKHLRGLDASDTWNPEADYPVTCLDCKVLHSPKKHWKIPKWQGKGRQKLMRIALTNLLKVYDGLFSICWGAEAVPTWQANLPNLLPGNV